MSGESLLVILLIGAIAGWLAGQIVQGTGFGLIADIVIGIIGAFIGSWLLPKLGINLGSGIVAAIIAATIGAALLLLLLGLVGRSRGRVTRGGSRFNLSAPTFLTFVISVVLAVIAALSRYAGITIPIIGAAHVFDLLAVAYVLLLAGVMFRGI